MWQARDFPIQNQKQNWIWSDRFKIIWLSWWRMWKSEAGESERVDINRELDRLSFLAQSVFIWHTLHIQTHTPTHICSAWKNTYWWRTDVDVMGWKTKINHHKNNTSFCQEFLPRPQTQCEAYMHLAGLNERIGVALTGYSAS